MVYTGSHFWLLIRPIANITYHFSRISHHPFHLRSPKGGSTIAKETGNRCVLLFIRHQRSKIKSPSWHARLWNYLRILLDRISASDPSVKQSCCSDEVDTGCFPRVPVPLSALHLSRWRLSRACWVCYDVLARSSCTFRPSPWPGASCACIHACMHIYCTVAVQGWIQSYQLLVLQEGEIGNFEGFFLGGCSGGRGDHCASHPLNKP